MAGNRLSLHKALQYLRWASPRRCLRDIRRGVVIVDDEQVFDPLRIVDLSRASIAVYGMELSPKPSTPTSIIWHKSAGSRLDDGVAGSANWISPCGTLPQSAGGIVLLTNENRYADHESAPIAHLSQDFNVRVQRRPTTEELNDVVNNIQEQLTLPFDVQAHIATATTESVWLSFTGARYRLQDCARGLKMCGLEVLSWNRARVGPFTADDLERGSWQRVKTGEIAALDAMLAAGIDDSTALDDVYDEIVRSASN